MMSSNLNPIVATSSALFISGQPDIDVLENQSAPIENQEATTPETNSLDGLDSTEEDDTFKTERAPSMEYTEDFKSINLRNENEHLIEEKERHGKSMLEELANISSKLSLKEKLLWLESGLCQVRSHLNGKEVWFLSKKGHAIKMKCLIKTNELPVFSGTGKPSMLRFLKEIRNNFVQSGVPPNEWVKIAASRLKGVIRSDWDQMNEPQLHQWDKFTEFLTHRIDIRRKERVTTRKMRQNCVSKRKVGCNGDKFHKTRMCMAMHAESNTETALN